MGSLWDFEQYAELPALIGDTGVTLTYRELETHSNEAENAIRECRERRDGTAMRESADRADEAKPLTMFVCRNSLGAIAGYAALMNRGFSVLPFSAELPQEMRKELMKAYRPGFLLLPEEKRGEYPSMKEVWRFRDYILLRTNYMDPFSAHPELGLLIPTSGSTGSAKYVRQSRKNLRVNAEAIAGILQIGSGDKTITALPLQYTYGLSVLHANLLRGATMVVTQSGVMDPEFWDLFEAEEVTCFHGVPDSYEMLYRIGVFEEDFPSLQTMSQAGGKLGRELQKYYGEYAEKNGKRFVIMYGQSEATAAISYLPAVDVLRKPGSVGIVIPGGEIRLADPSGKTVTEAGRQGEIIYRGANAAMGYAQGGEDLKRADEWNGEIRTGDLAVFDEERYLTITGRIKRTIKMAGHRISLDEIDSMIMDELNILSASVGTDDHLTVFVTEEQEKEPVAAFISGKIPAVRAGFRVLTIPEFPRNEGGKILFSVLQEAAAVQNR